MDGPLRQQHSDFPQATKHLLHPQGCKFTLRHLAPAGKRFLVWLKKANYDKGWEATSIPALKRRIKEEAWQISFPTILNLFNMVKEQLAVCAQDGYWAVYRKALNHAPLGTNLPRNIDEITYFCL